MMKRIPLLDDIQQCRLCEDVLPNKPRPILQASHEATLLIIGQAPGLKAHESHRPFTDASGHRLRSWLNMDEPEFYDETKVAIMPMGFCYPGKAKSGDKGPSKLCAPKWHQSLIDTMHQTKLILLIGAYAQNYYLSGTEFYRNHANLTERVKNTQSAPSNFICLPHPSPRNQIWLKKNPWFNLETLPYLQQRLRQL